MPPRATTFFTMGIFSSLAAICSIGKASIS